MTRRRMLLISWMTFVGACAFIVGHIALLPLEPLWDDPDSGFDWFTAAVLFAVLPASFLATCVLLFVAGPGRAVDDGRERRLET